jgi:hypothetical protein
MSPKSFLLLSFTICLWSCNNTPKPPKTANTDTINHKPQWQPPPEGTVVAHYEEAIPEDKLNNGKFQVSIISTADSDIGKYTLKLGFKANINTTELQLPEWKPGIVLQPALKKAPEKYKVLVGFIAENNVFKEYYEVTADHKNIHLKKTMRYTLSERF